LEEMGGAKKKKKLEVRDNEKSPHLSLQIFCLIIQTQTTNPSNSSHKEQSVDQSIS